jgi:5'-3' exoribonuclease 2
MLSLLSPHNIKLLREIPEFQVPIHAHHTEKFLTLDIDELRQCIVREFNPDATTVLSTAFVKDYVIVCAMLGNDFIPSLSYMKIKHNAIDVLMRAYNEARTLHPGTYMISDNNKININFMRDLLVNIAKTEDANMKEMNDVYFSKRPHADRRNSGPLQHASFELDNYPAFNKSGKDIDPNIPGWRMRYYEHLFGARSSQNISNVCDAYASGLQWVVEYYTSHDAPLSWYYPYTYSPTILDISNYYCTLQNDGPAMLCQLTDQEFIKMMKNPYMQLVAVLPPQSSHILPEKIRSIMVSLPLGCVHYYPTSFQISTYLKYYLWECSPLLPDVDFVHLHSTLQNIKT